MSSQYEPLRSPLKIITIEFHEARWATGLPVAGLHGCSLAGLQELGIEKLFHNLPMSLGPARWFLLWIYLSCVGNRVHPHRHMGKNILFTDSPTNSGDIEALVWLDINGYSPMNAPKNHHGYQAESILDDAYQRFSRFHCVVLVKADYYDLSIKILRNLDHQICCSGMFG